ncbi:MAG: hypothetical protein AB7N76_17215 [Planctomycetota bacterium]
MRRAERASYALVALAWLAGGAPAGAQTRVQAEAARLRARRATVLLEAPGPRGPDYGVGFFVARDVVVTERRWLPAASREAGGLHATVQDGEVRRWLPCEALAQDELVAYLRVRGEGTPEPVELPGELPVAWSSKVQVLGYRRDGRSAPPTAEWSPEVPRLGGPERGGSVYLGHTERGFITGGPVLDPEGRLYGLASGSGYPQVNLVECAWIERGLAGRVLGYRVERATRREHTYSLELSLPVLDPLKRLQGLELRCWTQAAQDGLELIEGPRRLRRAERAVPVEWRPARQAYAAILEVEVPPDSELWLEVHVKTAGPPRPPVWGRVRDAQRLVGVSMARAERLDQVPTATMAEELRPLPARRERGVEGRSQLLVDTRCEQLRFPRRLRDVCAPPSGREFYAVEEGRSEVLVCDAVSLRLLDRIATPRFPVSLWCDETHLVMACDESRLVRVIDRKSHAAVQVQRAGEDWVPYRAVGKAPLGGWASIWRRRQGEARGLVLLLEADGASRRLARHADDDTLETLTLLAGPPRAIYQQPRGVAQLIYLGARPPGDGVQVHPVLRQAQDGQDRFATSGASFLTADLKRVVLPLQRRSPAPPRPWTYVLGADLGLPVIEFPGVAIGEGPGYFVSLVDFRTEWGRGPFEVHYVQRSSGALLRRVLVRSLASPLSPLTRRQRLACFVAGAERLLVQGAESVLNVIPCGPLAPGLESPSLQPTTAPPSRAGVGKPYAYAPAFASKPPAGAVFGLAKAPTGASVDPATGAVRWTPGPGMLGSWEFELVARVEGEELPVAAWVVEVD